MAARIVAAFLIVALLQPFALSRVEARTEPPCSARAVPSSCLRGVNLEEASPTRARLAAGLEERRWEVPAALPGAVRRRFEERLRSQAGLEQEA